MRNLLILLTILCLSILAKGQNFIVVKSEKYQKPDTLLYYIPDSASDTSSLPTVILLNGYGGSFRQWSRTTNLQLLSNEYKMLLVCPDGFKDTWYIDSPQGNNNYATFFREDILPEIETKLPVDTSLIFITGFSMGGHGALYLFMQTPEKFRAVGSLSGVMNLRESSLAKTYLTKILGPLTADNSNWEKYSAIQNINNLKQANKPMIICCGAQDHLIEVNRKFAQKCFAAGIDIVYTESPGKHDKAYCAMVLPEQLRFFNKFKHKK